MRIRLDHFSHTICRSALLEFWTSDQLANDIRARVLNELDRGSGDFHLSEAERSLISIALDEVFDHLLVGVKTGSIPRSTENQGFETAEAVCSLLFELDLNGDIYARWMQIIDPIGYETLLQDESNEAKRDLDQKNSEFLKNKT